MTIDQLEELCVNLQKQGRGKHTVVLSRDAEGNSFVKMDDDYLTCHWKDGDVIPEAAKVKPNAVVFYPE